MENQNWLEAKEKELSDADRVEGLERLRKEIAEIRRDSSKAEARSLVAGAFITAIIIPILGLILSIILLVRGKTATGVGSLVLSLFCLGLWCSVAPSLGF